MQISKNFSLEELTGSETARKYAIDNEPTEAVKAKLVRLVNEVLQPIRDEYGYSIQVSSGYRCPALNAKVKGSKTSQHLQGEAADIVCHATSKAALFNCIKLMVQSGRLKVGQLIWEYGTKKEPSWVHVSLPRSNKPNNQILVLGVK